MVEQVACDGSTQMTGLDPFTEAAEMKRRMEMLMKMTIPLEELLTLPFCLWSAMRVVL